MHYLIVAAQLVILLCLNLYKNHLYAKLYEQGIVTGDKHFSWKVLNRALENATNADDVKKLKNVKLIAVLVVVAFYTAFAHVLWYFISNISNF